MKATVDCPRCGLPTSVDPTTAIEVGCACGWRESIDASALRDDRVERCPFCGTTDLYVEKDFPHRVGVVIVALGVILATIAWANYWWVGTFGALFLFGVLDAILYYTRKNVTVCYRCLAQFRRAAANPAHLPFDLAIGERYRQERLRKRKLRRENDHAGEG